MKKIILFVDGRYAPGKTFLDKSIELAQQMKCLVEIVFDSRKMFPKRWYWLDILGDDALQESLASQQESVLASITERLLSKGIKYNLHEVDNPDLATLINKIAVKDESPLLMVDSQLNAKKHELMSQLSQIKIPVYIATTKPWHQPVNLAVAIDPMHENANVRQTDQKLVRQMKIFNKLFATKPLIVHSCFIPPIAIAHKKAISKMHEEELKGFVSSHNISHNDLVLLEGSPEISIVKWGASQQIDILITGLLARDQEAARRLGSTTHSLIEGSPFDLLLTP